MVNNINAHQSIEDLFSKIISSNNTVPHAIIIEGNLKEDRDKLACSLAKWAICSSEAHKPCMNCCGCKKVDNNIHPDVINIIGSGSSNAILIDDIRKIISDAYIIANEAKNKVYILNDTDNMTEQAQNAILKIMEEPPKNVMFIFTCLSSFSLLVTVRSRANVFTINSNNDIIPDDKAFEIANQLALSLVDKKDFSLLSAVNALGKDKKLALKVLELLKTILRDAFVYSQDVDISLSKSSVVPSLAKSLAKSDIIGLIDCTNEFIDMIPQNVNMNLFTTCLCANFQNIIKN